MKVNMDNISDEKVSDKSKTTKFLIIVLVLLFFVFIFVNFNVNRTKNQLIVQLHRTTTQVGQLESAIDEVTQQLEEDAHIEVIALTEEEEVLESDDEVSLCEYVAYLQNQYRYVPIDNPDFVDKMGNISSKLYPCFDENDMSGRSMWYPYVDDGVPGTWEFASNTSSQDGTSKVLWLCYADDPDNPNDHSLLSYCTSTYNADTQLFTDTVVEITSYALNVAMVKTGSPNSVEDLTEIADIADAINHTDTVDNVTPPADQEYVNEASTTREDYKNKVANGEIEWEEYGSR